MCADAAWICTLLALLMLFVCHSVWYVAGRYPFDVWAVTLHFTVVLLLGSATPEQVRAAASVIGLQTKRLSARAAQALCTLANSVWPQIPGTAHARLGLCLSLIAVLLKVQTNCALPTLARLTSCAAAAGLVLRRSCNQAGGVINYAASHVFGSQL